ncbi:MAG: Protein LemA [Parabacteroides sp.]
MGIIIASVILGLIVIGIVSGGIAVYNQLIMLKYNVDKSFANIDVILKQRVDEIPNLIAVVKETRGYEESLLKQLTELRTAFLSSRSSDEKVQLANEAGKLLHSFFAVSENYPELKAVESFHTLQLRVSELENMLSDRRELYNESVNMYNIGIHEMPALLFARPMGYTDKPLLHISEEEKKYDGIRF